MNLPRASHPPRWRRAFTLVELMIVVAIMGVILAIGIPSVLRSWRKEGMRKAVGDIVDACTEARSVAILNGVPTEVIIHPQEGTITVVPTAPEASEPAPVSPETPKPKAPPVKSSFSAKLPENVVMELLGVNFQEFQEADEARIRFFPNGTCDEFTILLRSNQQEVRKISAELVTALVDVEVVR